MIEFIAFLILFGLIYQLRQEVKVLQKQLYSLQKPQKQTPLDIEQKPVFKPLEQANKVEKQVVVEKPILLEEPLPITEIPSSPQPSIFNKVIGVIKSYFTQGNIVVRIGGVILFFGLAFLVKYASEHGVISIELRLIAVTLLSIALIGAGWRFRKRQDHYGVILQGIGVAILYLVVFVAAKFYILFPLGLAFSIMFLIVIFGSILAVMQNALPLAIFAISGGFIAPILTSDGTGSHVMLFSYFALLNSGILGIAWYRSWRVLNLTGFFFTFFIATAWGVLKYDATLLASTEPFLILFFVFYLVVSILFTLKQTFEPRGLVDASLVFGLPLVAFSLQSSLVHQIEYALAYTALAMGTLYLILYKTLSRYAKMHLLSEAFLALGVIFYTVAIPYIFDDHITGALWALESSAIIWIALKQSRNYSRMFGELLQLIGIVLYVTSPDFQEVEMAFINTFYLGYVILAISAFISSYFLSMYKSQLNNIDKDASFIFLGIALGLLIYSGFIEANNIESIIGNTMLIYTAIWGAILSIVASRLKWDNLAQTLQGYLVLGVLLFLSLLSYYEIHHPFKGLGSIAITLFFGVHYFLLYTFNSKWTKQTILHVVGLWSMVFIGILEVYYQLSLITDTTYLSTGVGAFLIIVATIILYTNRYLPSVFQSYKETYRTLGVGGILLVLFIWELSSLSLDANPTPLPYIPLLNPLDLTQLVGFTLIYKWVQRKENTLFTKNTNIIYSIVGITTLLFSTIVLARAIHSYLHIDYSVFALSHSIVFQMSLSLMWSIMAMLIIMVAKSLKNRIFWIAGASLMGVVIVKLFFVELSNSGSVERIISFIVVGLLLLLIGYFAPLPPLKTKE